MDNYAGFYLLLFLFTLILSCFLIWVCDLDNFNP